MKQYTVHQAKTNLSRLLQEAEAGQEVVIARGAKPEARIVAIGSSRRKRVPGKFVGQVSCTDDAFAPLTNRELEDMGFE